MPAREERETRRRARQDLRHGKSPTTASGEFVHEEIDHIRRGKHGARSTKQAIAIGLAKARRAGVPLKPPKRGSPRTKRAAKRDYAVGQHRAKARPASKRRGHAALAA